MGPFKGGALGCSLLSLLGNPALAIVKNVVRPIDGHFEIQYGHHANNPRWFIIARLDDPKNLYFAPNTLSINLTSLELEIELNMYLLAVILKSK